MGSECDKIAFLSDIHGTFPALEKAYRRARRHTECIVCLGDVVDGGGQDQECVDFMREHQIPTVRGNHDEDFLLLEGHMLTESAREWLKALPRWLELDNILLIHDDPSHHSSKLTEKELGSNHSIAVTSIKRETDADDAFMNSEFLLMNDNNLAAIGHSHHPAVFTPAGGLPLKPAEPIPIPRGVPCILNPGTVGGVPRRGGWPNTYGVLNKKARTFTIFRLGQMSPQKRIWDEHFKRMKEAG